MGCVLQLNCFELLPVLLLVCFDFENCVDSVEDRGCLGDCGTGLCTDRR